jgi:hypothetical protein
VIEKELGRGLDLDVYLSRFINSGVMLFSTQNHRKVYDDLDNHLDRFSGGQWQDRTGGEKNGLSKRCQTIRFVRLQT